MAHAWVNVTYISDARLSGVGRQAQFAARAVTATSNETTKMRFIGSHWPVSRSYPGRLCRTLLGAAVADRATHDSGQSVTGAFEGWFQNPDGSFSLLLGYYNRNLKQELDIPVGPDNRIDPGGPDQGQPTHFLPGRQWGVFTVTVPKDFGIKKLTWTLTANGNHCCSWQSESFVGACRHSAMRTETRLRLLVLRRRDHSCKGRAVKTRRS